MKRRYLLCSIAIAFCMLIVVFPKESLAADNSLTAHSMPSVTINSPENKQQGTMISAQISQDLSPQIPISNGGNQKDNNGLTVEKHKMSLDEVKEMKKTIGVRDESKNYNEIIDGHGTGLAPPTDEEWNSMVGNATVVENITSTQPKAMASYDLSTSAYFPPIGNQGSQGSCAAWASTYYSYGYLEAKDNGWTDAYLGATNHLFSPSWTYNKVNYGTDSGSNTWNNFEVIEKWGAVTTDIMPYNAADWTSYGSTAAFREAPLHRADSQYMISYSGIATVNTVRSLISSGTPVTFCIDANGFPFAFWDLNTIISSAEYSSSTTNHAMTIVGYNDAVSDDGDVGAFKVANSWGTGWGSSGYCWLTYNAFMEIGSLLQLTYVEDISNYSPTMLAIWQFDSPPSRDAEFELGLGNYGSPLVNLIPTLTSDSNHYMPYYMCIDISAFSSQWYSGNYNFYMHITSSYHTGTLSSFKIEHYTTWSYYPSYHADQVSGQASGVKLTNPGLVTNTFPYYSPMTINDALDIPAICFTSYGFSPWTPVINPSVYDGDAVQSGNVNNGGYSYLETDISGPAIVRFDWRVSSESNYDILTFYLNGFVFDSISGSSGWQSEELNFGSGNENLMWVYSKDVSIASNSDCGWIDHLIVDSSPPITTAVIAGTSGTNGWYTSNVQVSLNAVDETTVYGTWYLIDGVGWNTYSNPFTITTEGYHTITYYSRDNQFYEDVKNTAIKIDKTAPSLAINQQNGMLFKTKNPQISWSASDGMSGLSSIKVYLDGAFYSSYSASTTSTIFSSLSEGLHIVEIYAYDNAGLLTQKSIKFYIDTVPPSTSAKIIGNLGSDSWYVGNVGVDLTVQEATSGVASTSYRINTGSWQTYLTQISLTSEGTYTINYYSTDIAGNSEPTRSVAIKIDKTAPTTTAELTGAVGLNGWYTSEVDLALTGTDANAGIKVIRYSIDSGPWEDYTGTIIFSENGNHYVSYYSEDNASNSNLPSTMMIKIDTLSPTFAFSGTTNGTTYSSNSVTISWSSSDYMSGIDHFEYSIDGGAYTSTGNATYINLSGLADGSHSIKVRTIDKAGNVAERTLSFNVDTNVFSMSGPFGPMLDVGLIAAILAGIFLVLFLVRRRKKKATEQEPMPPMQPQPPQNP